MIVRPMLGDWELPCVERVDLLEARRLARLGVPGLTGDLHQDMGTQSLTVAITGSLEGDGRILASRAVGVSRRLLPGDFNTDALVRAVEAAPTWRQRFA